jgi:hypothetical protein
MRRSVPIFRYVGTVCAACLAQLDIQDLPAAAVNRLAAAIDYCGQPKGPEFLFVGLATPLGTERRVLGTAAIELTQLGLRDATRALPTFLSICWGSRLGLSGDAAVDEDHNRLQARFSGMNSSLAQ